MAKKDYCFVATRVERLGFGKTAKKTVKLRETVHHYIEENGTKYNKRNGNSTNGHYYKGTFMGRFWLELPVQVGDIG